MNPNRTTTKTPFRSGSLILLSCLIAFLAFTSVSTPIYAHGLQQNSSNTKKVSCSQSLHLNIDSASVSDCFDGTGYLGYRINDITFYGNLSNHDAWILIYADGSSKGCFLDLPLNTNNPSNNIYFDGHHSITQIGIGISHGSNTCQNDL